MMGGKSRKQVWAFEDAFRCLKIINRCCKHVGMCGRRLRTLEMVQNGCRELTMVVVARKWVVGPENGWDVVGVRIRTRRW